MLFRTLLFLGSLKTEIEYTKLPVPAIITKLSQEKELNKLHFLPECVKLLKDGKDFPYAWQSVLSGRSLFKKEEKDKLLSLGSFLGISDISGQVTIISLYITYFEQYLSQAKTSSKKYGAAAPVFCFFIGSIIFILSL